MFMCYFMVGMNPSDGKLLVYSETLLFWTSFDPPKVHAMFWDVLKYRSILIWNKEVSLHTGES